MPDATAFLVAAPQAGDAELLEALAQASGVFRPRTREPDFLDALPGVRAGHRLTVADATPELAAAARAALRATLVDREGRTPDDAPAGGTAIAGGPRLAPRVPFLAEAFPQARFVLVTGAPADAAPAQQRAVAQALLDDLQALPAERWCTAEHAALLADPRTELRRLCAFLELPYDQALLTPLEEARRVRRAAAPVAAAPSGGAAEADSPYASVSTGSFAQQLEALGSSLLISTYQTGKLIVAREHAGTLNTHFRDVEKPMGIAVAPGRFALGTRTEVWDLRDMPEVAPKVEPVGLHDACYLPRNRHVTGDISVHELGFAGGELWVVATAFSCLATLDADHSFVPRWRPPFVSAIAPGDRCHLNGLAVVADAVRYVTALGQTDEPGGWRAGKASGGVILDVPSSEVVVAGLSMPHSPRWHDDRLWVLQSGRGELGVVDLATGTVEAVAELPGFTRGMAIVGRTAFVGLSQIRESSTFGDLPLTQRLQERLCGVWMVDLDRGAITGFLRFDDLVQEIFDVAVLSGTRYPEVAQPGSSAVALSYALP
jgi:uncharacterized protein (TIGR03032 family)